jgi:hypothetical protein
MGVDADELRNFSDGLAQDIGPDNDCGTNQLGEHDSVPTLRPLSPTELIEEVHRISVPSVTGLAQRLSELLPSLRPHLGDNSETIDGVDQIEKTLIELHHLGQSDGIGLPGNAGLTRRATNPRSVGRPLSVPPPEVAELPGAFSFTSPGRARSASDSEVDWLRLDIISRLGLPLRRSPPRSRSPNGTRPWNVESSYPWSNSIPLIDISFPIITVPQGAAALPQSKLRHRLSTPNDDSSLEQPSNPTASLGMAEATADLRPKSGKRRSRLLGSLSYRIRSGQSCGTATSGPGTSSITIGPKLHYSNDSERSVGPGDRYPTTGLSPPGGLVFDDVQSFFSDDDESNCSTAAKRPARAARARRGVGPRAGVGSFGKRLTTSIRARLPGQNSLQPNSVKPTRVIPGAELAHGDAAADKHPPDVIGADSARDGADLASDDTVAVAAAVMSPTKVKAKRLVDRLRVFLWRGSELLRSMSGRRGGAATSAVGGGGDSSRRGKESSSGTRSRAQLGRRGRRLRRPRRPQDPTEQDGWSEDGESMTDWSSTQEYDAGATAMARDISARATASVIRE